MHNFGFLFIFHDYQWLKYLILGGHYVTKLSRYKEPNHYFNIKMYLLFYSKEQSHNMNISCFIYSPKVLRIARQDQIFHTNSSFEAKYRNDCIYLHYCNRYWKVEIYCNNYWLPKNYCNNYWLPQNYCNNYWLPKNYCNNYCKIEKNCNISWYGTTKLQ